MGAIDNSQSICLTVFFSSACTWLYTSSLNTLVAMAMSCPGFQLTDSWSTIQFDPGRAVEARRVHLRSIITRVDVDVSGMCLH